MLKIKIIFNLFIILLSLPLIIPIYLLVSIFILINFNFLILFNLIHRGLNGATFEILNLE